jgi:integrase
MRHLKHVPLASVPDADIRALQAAYEPGDVFDDAEGSGAHLAFGMRKMILTAYRRWLGFLNPDELLVPAVDRITRERVRAYVNHLSTEIRPVSIAICLEGLSYAARFMGPARDWEWLASIAARLRACAIPEDRFSRLTPGWCTLDYGIGLMDAALVLATTRRKEREIQYRDGLLLAILSLWPIRRRSVAALTIGRHLEFDEGGASVLLHPEDTKSKKSESCRLHEELVPYLKRYLSEIRPRLLGSAEQRDGMWVSYRGRPLTAGSIYDIIRKRTTQGFGKAMGLHDFRRAAATFLATEAPEMVGLIPGILQHAKPEVGEQHYNLARSIGASRRHLAALEHTRDELRLFVR